MSGPRVLFTVCVFALTATMAGAIFRGRLSEDETVLALGKWGANGALVPVLEEQDDPVFIGTANVIEFQGIDQRCVLTAKHVAPCAAGKNPPCEGADAKWHRAVLEQNVRTLTGAKRDQLVARTGAVMPNLPGHDTYRDLRVNWLEYKKSTETDARIELDDYQAVEIVEAPLGWLPPEFDEQRYLITGYGHNAGVARGRGIRRYGWPIMNQLEVRTTGNGGARIRSSFVPTDRYSECYGDSGAAIDLGLGRFSAVSHGSLQHCDPRLRDPYPEPDPTVEEDEPPTGSGPPQPEPEPSEPPNVPGGTVFHSLLNSEGQIAQPPEDTVWADVGNWEQIKYQISNVCTKELNVRISGEGQVRGTLNTTLPWYDTDRLNQEIYCVGNGSPESGLGDCTEAIHQPETITLIAEARDEEVWEFEAWEPAVLAAPDDGPPADLNDCPCEGKGPTCEVYFEEIGTYTSEISDDRTFCVAKFKKVPQQGSCTEPPCPIPVE